MVYGIADFPDPLLPFGPLVALANVFERCRPPAKAAVWVGSATAAVIATVLTRDSDALDWWGAAFVLVAGPLVGDYLRTRRQLVDEATARLELLESELLAPSPTRGPPSERGVARELHDVVAHDVTMLVVQAEAAASRPPADGTAAAAVFDDLARSGAP